jgi:Homeodomain-like domain
MSAALNRRAQVVGLQRQGVPRREIAARLGVSLMTVSAFVRSTPVFRERSCALCGERCVPTNGRQRYCCPEHRAWHRLAMSLELECPHCGAAFTPQHEHEHSREHVQQDAHSAPVRQRRPRPARGTVSAWTEYLQLLEGDVARMRAQLEARG